MEEVQSQELIRLKTIRTIGRLLADTASCLEQLDHRQTRFMMRVCKSKLSSLQEKDNRDSGDRRRLMLDKISGLGDLRLIARQVGEGRTISLLSEDCVRTLRRLVLSLHFNLAERLIADLELEITAAAVFLKTVTRLPEVPIPFDFAETNADDRWSLATRGVLTHAVRAISSEMQSLNARALGVRHQFENLSMEHQS
jgi:hypothetical protein